MLDNSTSSSPVSVILETDSTWSIDFPGGSVQHLQATVRPFLNAVWKVFHAMCMNHLVAYHRSPDRPGEVVRDMWLAPDAKRWHEAGGLLASNAADLYYTPQQE